MSADASDIKHDQRREGAKALLASIYERSASGRAEEAIAICGEAISRFAEDPDPLCGATAAEAAFKKGLMLGLAGRDEEAIVVYEALAVNTA